MIGLALLSLIISLLFQSMSSGKNLDGKLDTIRKASGEKEFLHVRLSDVFLKVVNTEKNCFYTQSFPKQKDLNLALCFDNGIDPDPVFSGTVIGRIFLDDQKRLSLAIWPFENHLDNPVWRKEILCASVDSFHFEFFKLDEPTSKWVKTWPKESTFTPIMVRLYLKQNGQNSSFAFFLAG